MATQAQRAARRRQRARRATRRNGSGRVMGVGPMAPGAVAQILGGRKRTSGGKRRNQRGLLSNIGGMLLPGIGNSIGQVADNLVGGLVGGFLGGGKSNAAPVAMAGRLSSMQANRSEEHGVEQIATVVVPAGTPAGTIILQVPIAAPTIGVRLSSFSRLWTKTFFRKFIVHVTSSNPSTVGGNYTIAIDPDPAQTYQSGSELPARLMALTMAERSNAWADAALQMIPNLVSLFNRYHIEGSSDAELREFAAGQLIMATSTEYDTDCTYTVNVGWDVVFEKPDTSDPNSTGPPDLMFDLSGAAYTITGGSPYVVTIANASRFFNIAPGADFAIASPALTLVVPNSANNGNLDVLVDNLSYVVSTNTLTIDARISNVPNLSNRIYRQNPAPYYVNVPALTFEHGLPNDYCMVGYKLTHPSLVRGIRQDLDWKSNAQENRLKKLKSSVYSELLRDHIKEEARHHTADEVTDLIRNLNVS